MISRDDLERVAAVLEGTCKNVEDVLEALGIEADPDDVEDQLLEISIERCPYCAWWMESCEMVNDDNEVVGCDQCREPEEDDD